ncbi:MAG: translation elongation factor Ts, partial [Pseudomonadota bacterium]
MVEVNCETDFVSKNDSFIAFCQGVADLAVKHADADIDAMAALPLTVDGFGPTVEDARKGLIGKIGENMTIRRVARSQGHAVTSYLHGTRIGVTVQYEGSEQAARDVAMHVAAMKPVALSSADVPAALVEQERSVAKAKAEESGKPPEIATKMIEGAVAKYLKEVSLLDQPFVKNDKQTVAQMLKAENTTVHAFTLYVVGEGIEKKADDFAAEVAAQVAAARQG